MVSCERLSAASWSVSGLSGQMASITSPSMPARRRETWLTDAIYRHHPRFAGTPMIYSHTDEWLEGGDVLALAPGVIAVGFAESIPSPVATPVALVYAQLLHIFTSTPELFVDKIPVVNKLTVSVSLTVKLVGIVKEIEATLVRKFNAR